MAEHLGGTTAIVTGGGSGIGAATARRLALEGAAVVVLDIDRTGGSTTVESIRAAGGRAGFVHGDVSRRDDVERAVAAVADDHGGVDILVNNAYWAPLNAPVHDTDDDDWERTLAVTLRGVFLCTRAVLPVMAAQRAGVIVNLASTAALQSRPAFAAYSAAKGGVVALTRSVARDYGGDGVRCNAVAPGLIETPATAGLLADPDLRARYERETPVGRIGSPDDVAAAIVFLTSSEAAFITGQVLVVDGGRNV